MQFRIAGLLGILGVVGFVCVSLARADALFETLFFSFALLMMLAAMLFAIARPGAARVYWLAFVLSSAIYFVFTALIPRLDGPEITTQLLRVGFNLLHPAQADDPFFADDPSFSEAGWDRPLSTSFAPNEHGLVESPVSKRFMRIGHASWALLLGWMSGHFTRFAYERYDAKKVTRHRRT